MGFSKDFVWGAATSSYQIEGAAFEDGKGRSVWDVFSHTKGKILDNSTGDVACDHYHKFKEDVKLMADLGLKAYRFSISWARIMPTGTGDVNEAGVKFYSDLIDELLKYGIEPYVTLYHWDLPYDLHTQGGWLNDDMPDIFAEYAAVCADMFKGRVKNVLTFNEPQVFIGLGYMQGTHAPGLLLGQEELLHISHNVLKAHGKATKVLREKIPNVKIGFACASSPRCPVTDKDIPAAAADYFACDSNNFIFTDAMWLDPIFFGKYPEQLVKDCGEDLTRHIKDGDMEIIKTGLDFVGLNIYRGFFVKADENGKAVPQAFPAGVTMTALTWEVVPESLYWGPRLINERYKAPIIITENGMAAHDCVSVDGKVHDPNRIDFLHRYIREYRRAADDGVECLAYFQWSLMDNYEWAYGYTGRFGMVYVDLQTCERIPKDSAYWYKTVIESNGENL